MHVETLKEGKNILITGGTRGIGFALVQHFAQNTSNRVLTTATSDSGVQNLKEKLESLSLNNVLVKKLILGSKDSLTSFLQEIKDENFPCDTLIHNAGITQDNVALRMSDQQFEDVINVNLTSAFSLTKGILRSMLKKRSGSIVFLSSVVASMGNPGQANYCSSKAGVLGLMRSLSLEYASKNITVNAVSPGFIETDMTRKLTEAQVQKMQERIACERFGQPEDICHAVDFLTSSKASYITGQNLHVNGGLYLG